MQYHFLQWVLGLTFLSLAVDVRASKRCGQQRMPNVPSSSPWPWMASINGKTGNDSVYVPRCSGFLIDCSHVITVAHCFDNKKITHHQARIGHVDWTRGERYSIIKVLIHEHYTIHKYYNNIAILTLDRSVTEPGFNPVCLPNKEVRSLNLDNERTTVVGWSGEHSQIALPVNILQQLKGMPVETNEQCERAYRANIPAFRNMFPEGINCKIMCAGFPEGGKAACRGTSGGPLMIQRDNSWYVVGINSFSYQCGVPGVPGGFTRVSEYLEWIWKNAFDY